MYRSDSVVIEGCKSVLVTEGLVEFFARFQQITLLPAPLALPTMHVHTQLAALPRARTQPTLVDIRASRRGRAPLAVSARGSDMQ